MKASRGVRRDSFTLVTPANHYPSRLPPFGDAPVVKLATPRFAPARFGEYLLSLPAGGGTVEPVAAGFETFLYALERDATARVDGAASNECGELVDELRAALVLARVAHGPAALTARDALELATRHGARCLGREDELGHLSVGALADVALWDLDEAGFAGIADPVAALAFGPTRHVDALLVGGELVVEDGELRTADPVTLARGLERASARMREAA